MREINKIFVHCAATKPSQDVPVETIRQWHLNNGWVDIGYHYYITKDGIIHKGRSDETQGAHVSGHNSDSIGICLEGGVNEQNQPDANFSFNQYVSLRHVLVDLMTEHGLTTDDVYGHRDEAAKACPSFDIHAFVKHM